MPTPLVAIVSAVVLTAGGVGVGSELVGSGGTSKAPAATVPALSADPTRPPEHRGFRFQPTAPAQAAVPGLGQPAGQVPKGGAPAAGPSYIPRGQPSAPLGPIPTPSATRQATTWPLYLSGGDLLQPDGGAADGTDQSVGANIGGACGNGLAGRWTTPTTATFPFHGTLPGLLHVVASGTATLNISLTYAVYGQGCTVLSTTSVSATGTQPVNFTLPRVDADLAAGGNISLVVETTGSAHILSSAAAPSYVIAPTPPQ